MGNCMSDTAPPPPPRHQIDLVGRGATTSSRPPPPPPHGQPPSQFSATGPIANGGNWASLDSPQAVKPGTSGISRKSGEVLIVSYDIGTTASGCAYIYRQADGTVAFGPEVVDVWPGQTALSLGKTPSILFYDQRGICHTDWGAQCLAPQWSPARLRASGLQMVEWFKLHVDPAGVPAEHLQGPGRQLPPGVTVWQVYSDYLQRLHAAAVGRIRTRRGADLFDRLSAAGKVQYIVTIPAGWQKPAITGELRRCAVRAGLIAEENSSGLDFCSEPEASALECYESAAQLSLKPDDIFTVVDAGGGTVDLTTYQIISTFPALELREVDIGAPRCIYRGSTFVDKSFQEYLHARLLTEYPAVYREQHLIRGKNLFTSATKLGFSGDKRDDTFLQLSDDPIFEEGQGHIVLKWHEIEQCFKPHVDRIVAATKEQIETAEGRSKVIFCCGGFGSNAYLRQKLEAAVPHVKILQPGDMSTGSKAVCLGANRYGMFRSVRTRKSPAWYGVQAYRAYKASDQSLLGYMEHVGVGKLGQQIVTRTFAKLLSLADNVGDDEWRESDFSMEIADGSTELRSGNIRLYQSRSYQLPNFVDDPGVELVCQIDVYVPPHSQGRLIKSVSGQTYRAYKIVVLMSLGRADLKTRVLIDGIEAGGATVTWETPSGPLSDRQNENTIDATVTAPSMTSQRDLGAASPFAQYTPTHDPPSPVISPFPPAVPSDYNTAARDSKRQTGQISHPLAQTAGRSSTSGFGHSPQPIPSPPMSNSSSYWQGQTPNQPSTTSDRSERGQSPSPTEYNPFAASVQNLVPTNNSTTLNSSHMDWQPTPFITGPSRLPQANLFQSYSNSAPAPVLTAGHGGYAGSKAGVHLANGAGSFSNVSDGPVETPPTYERVLERMYGR